MNVTVRVCKLSLSCSKTDTHLKSIGVTDNIITGVEGDWVTAAA